MLWESQRAGYLQMQASTQLKQVNGQWTWQETAPISGLLRAQLPRVGLWSLVAPPGWRLRGTVDADALLTGTRSSPQWKGTLQGDDFTVRSTLDGIDFNRGRLRVNLAGRQLDITEFTLQGADAGASSGGLLSMQGKVQLPDWRSDAALAPQVRIDLQAKAQGLRISTRADQRLVVSGEVDAHLGDSSMKVRGTLLADQGMFVLADDTAPRLGADIRLRTTQAAYAPEPEKGKPVAQRFPFTPDIALTLDLGKNFAVQGHGLITRLEGQVQLSTDKRYTPRLNGELHTVNGTYKAYGQVLDIEDGVLLFSGPYDNPSLNVLAIRPNLQQRVGVQIGGNVLSPVVRLYAEPDLPDIEKLSWLVVGRSAASGGAQTAMLQQAGMALLGGSGPGMAGNLAQTLGLDEISMSGLINSEDSSASTTPGATVTLGKRISRNFYVAYERSLAGAFSTFYVFYDLSRRFTLRGQTGEQSAVDLILTTRYD
jgi:translocation and assembly module TamB